MYSDVFVPVLFKLVVMIDTTELQCQNNQPDDWGQSTDEDEELYICC